MCLSPTLRTFRLATSDADDHPSGMRKILVPCIASDWRQRICGRGSSRNLFSECFPGGNSPGSTSTHAPLFLPAISIVHKDRCSPEENVHYSETFSSTSSINIHQYIVKTLEVTCIFTSRAALQVRFPYLHLLLHFVWLYVRISRSMPRRFYAFANVNPSLRWGMEPRPAHLIAAKTRAPRHRGPIIVRRRNSTSPSCLEHVTFR
ncbi:hypothetical protein SCP_0805150 [Sparassis crispa]|uniref:Uncharacterized protein n=1 Tax=Sparassis crispa TaxID=139825 RepID=A0A401GUT2_9APHY|nr:hypothetical protein SCP_0805150 [Sparassis crispa]GBE85991.1 hypothetical protein SCP_0805150 [Sparassis crispa]